MTHPWVRRDAALGHRLWREIANRQGRTLAFAGQWVTGELLEHIKAEGLEEELLCAVLGVMVPPPSRGIAAAV
jgi:hypothetical protein